MRDPIVQALSSGRTFLSVVHDGEHSGHTLDECTYSTYRAWREEFDEALLLAVPPNEPLGPSALEYQS